MTLKKRQTIIITIIIFITVVTTAFAQDVNGTIVMSELDAGNNGYIVLKVWGTYYEMGYARGRIMAENIKAVIETTRDVFTTNPTYEYTYAKSLVASCIWSDQALNDEINGLVAGVKSVYPTFSIDGDDIKLISTFGDWYTAVACKSSSAWGSYVDGTNGVKTISTRRLDYSDVSLFPGALHVIVAYAPSGENTQDWINFTWPGVVNIATAVREDGTLVSLHDDSANTNNKTSQFGPERLPRHSVPRYIMSLTETMTPGQTTQQAVAQYLSGLKYCTASYFNYYAPEGNGAVYDFVKDGLTQYRPAKPAYFNSEVIVTGNLVTDGTYTPADSGFLEDFYQTAAKPISIMDQWNCLYNNATNTHGTAPYHQVTVEYRNDQDITILFKGRIQGLTTTPLLTLDWSALMNNTKEQITASFDDPLLNRVMLRNSNTGAWKTLSSVHARDLASADVNHDGTEDLIGISSAASGVWINTAMTTDIWEQVGTMTATSIATGDLDKDGNDDIVTVSDTGIWYSSYTNSTWTWTQFSTTTPTDIACGDVGGDGYDDLVAVYYNNIWVRLSKSGDVQLSYTGNYRAVTVGDVNCDGIDEIFALEGTTIKYYDVNAGAFVDLDPLNPYPASALASGDIDGDGTDDLVINNAVDNGLWVRYSSPAPGTPRWEKLRDDHTIALTLVK